MSSKRFNSAKEVPIRVGCNEDFEEIIQLRDIPGPGEININSGLNKCLLISTHVQNCQKIIFFFKILKKHRLTYVCRDFHSKEFKNSSISISSYPHLSKLGVCLNRFTPKSALNQNSRRIPNLIL